MHYLRGYEFDNIKDLYEKFSSQSVKIGLSDHSMSIIPPIVSISLDAKAIENHFTLDRKLGSANSGFSLNPDEFIAIVKAVRKTEKSLGKTDYTINLENKKYARLLCVVKDIQKKEYFTKEDIC